MKNLIQVGAQYLPLVFFSAAILFGGFLFLTQEAQAQFGSCSEYGTMAYESGGYCKCMSGYVMGDGPLGRSYCISETQACQDQYGFNARANYSGGCECSYGYVFGTSLFGDKQCVSADSVCKDEYGLMSRYDSLSGSCECSYGYVIDGGRCVDGDQVCHNDHGYNSSYDSLSNSCECDYNYTFDDNYQCVEKQNNVYFKLLDINPENDKELLIKSDYDSRKYIVRIGIGCLSTSLSRYEGKNLVVNLGTDYEVDMFDTVVLQDHSQTCSIMHRERTYEDSFPEPEEDIYYYTPPSQTYTPTAFSAEPVYTPETVPTVTYYEQTTTEIENTETQVNPPTTETHTGTIINETQTSPTGSSSTESPILPEAETIEVDGNENFFTKILNFFKSWF